MPSADENDKLKKRISILEKQVESQMNRIMVLGQENTRLKNDIKKNVDRNDGLEKELDNLITDNKYWKEEYDLAELSISRKKNTIKDLQKKIDKLEKLKSCEAIAKLRTTLVKEIDYCLGR